MFGLKKLVERVQKKPYKTKVKILWAAVTAAFILIVMLWIVTIDFRRSGPRESAQPIFSELQRNIEKLKQSNPFAK